MGAGRHALGGLVGRKTGTKWKTAADAFGNRQMSGVMPAHSCANSLPVRPVPHCTSSKINNKPLSSQNCAKLPQVFNIQRPDTAFALHRLDKNAGRFRPNCRFDRLYVAKWNLIKAIDLGPEAFQIFGLPASSDCRQCAAMKRAFHGDDAVALRVAGRHSDSAAQF